MTAPSTPTCEALALRSSEAIEVASNDASPDPSCIEVEVILPPSSVEPSSPLDLVTARWLASSCLPGIPRTRGAVLAKAKREGWPCTVQVVRGGAVQMFPVSALPAEAQAELALRVSSDAPAPPSRQLEALDSVPAAHIERAREQLVVVLELVKLRRNGATLTAALAKAAPGNERSARRWYERCQKRPRSEWLTELLPKWKSSSELDECHPQAFAAFCDDYLRAQKPTTRHSYKEAVRLASIHGWTPVPSLRSMVRRLEREIDPAVVVWRREGRDAAELLLPVQTRSRAHYRALEAVNADGHRFDVFVRWPGYEHPVRITMVAFQDLYSGMILSWRFDLTENADVVRLALSDLVEHYGIPEHCYLDNGRAFASKWLTGQMKHRFRFKVRPEEPMGILTMLLGSEGVHWTTPYHGQAKPIERAFRDLCDRISKHIAFAGAYTGNNPLAKPEDYGTRAIDLAVFVKIASALIIEHNAEAGRNTETCRGRSFLETFEESYVASRHMIRQATDAQRRVLFLAAEGVQVRSGRTEVHLFGSRFYSIELTRYRGQPIVARFDPHHLARGLFVYEAASGKYICHARLEGKTRFDDVAAAKAFAKRKGDARKALRRAAEQSTTFSQEELAAMQLEAIGVTPELPPASNVVKLAFGVTSEERAKVDAIEVAARATDDERRARREDMTRAMGASALALLEPKRTRGTDTDT